MPTESRRNYFGLFTSKRVMKAGDGCALEQAPSFFARTDVRFDVEAIDDDTIDLTRTVNPFPAKASPYRREFKDVSRLTGSAINDAKIQGSRFLGIKDSVVWKPRKN